MKKRRKEKPAAPESDSVDQVGEDNSHRHIRPLPHPHFPWPPPIVETVLFSKVGHTFGPIQPQPGGETHVVQDFLLDQTGASGTDGKMSRRKQFDLTTAIACRFNIFPKDQGKRIKVLPPTGGKVFIGLRVGRKFVTAVPDVIEMYGATSYFTDLVGNTPIFTYSRFYIGRNTNHWVKFIVSAELKSPIAFLGFTALGTYPARAFDPGTKSYYPYNDSFFPPNNLPGPFAEPYMMLSYMTASSTDPGPFVSLS